MYSGAQRGAGSSCQRPFHAKAVSAKQSRCTRKPQALTGVRLEPDDGDLATDYANLGRVYGGRYVPETLMAALVEMEREYDLAKADAAFQAELADLLKNYAGRPTPLYFCKRLTEQLGGAKIYLKREDLLHTGAHKIPTRWARGCWPSGMERIA